MREELVKLDEKLTELEGIQRQITQVHLWLKHKYVDKKTDGVRVLNKDTFKMIQDIMHQYTLPVEERGVVHNCETCIFNCKGEVIGCKKWSEIPLDSEVQL